MLSEVIIMQRMTSRYNKRVVPHEFTFEDQVLRKVDVFKKNIVVGKLTSN